MQKALYHNVSHCVHLLLMMAMFQSNEQQLLYHNIHFERKSIHRNVSSLTFLWVYFNIPKAWRADTCFQVKSTKDVDAVVSSTACRTYCSRRNFRAIPGMTILLSNSFEIHCSNLLDMVICRADHLADGGSKRMSARPHCCQWWPLS